MRKSLSIDNAPHELDFPCMSVATVKATVDYEPHLLPDDRDLASTLQFHMEANCHHTIFA